MQARIQDIIFVLFLNGKKKVGFYLSKYDGNIQFYTIILDIYRNNNNYLNNYNPHKYYFVMAQLIQ